MISPASGAAEKLRDQRNQEEDDEDEEQDLGNTGRAGCDAGKTERAGDQRDDGEDDGVLEHVVPFEGPRALDGAACLQRSRNSRSVKNAFTASVCFTSSAIDGLLGQMGARPALGTMGLVHIVAPRCFCLFARRYI